MKHSDEAEHFLNGLVCDALSCTSKAVSVVPLYIDPRNKPTDYLVLCQIHLDEYKEHHIVALKALNANS
jgi:hypothetical protein